MRAITEFYRPLFSPFSSFLGTKAILSRWTNRYLTIYPSHWWLSHFNFDTANLHSYTRTLYFEIQALAVDGGYGYTGAWRSTFQSRHASRRVLGTGIPWHPMEIINIHDAGEGAKEPSNFLPKLVLLRSYRRQSLPRSSSAGSRE